jgi:hypothetical protein
VPYINKYTYDDENGNHDGDAFDPIHGRLAWDSSWTEILKETEGERNHCSK